MSPFVVGCRVYVECSYCTKRLHATATAQRDLRSAEELAVHIVDIAAQHRARALRLGWTFQPFPDRSEEAARCKQCTKDLTAVK